MGELIQFPGKHVEVSAMVDGASTREIAYTTITSWSRFREREIRGNIEEAWWDAYSLDDMNEQRRIEFEIGNRYGVSRGGQIIERLRITAKIHKAQHGENIPPIIGPNSED